MRVAASNLSEFVGETLCHAFRSPLVTSIVASLNHSAERESAAPVFVAKVTCL